MSELAEEQAARHIEERKIWREVNDVLGELHVDLSDYSDEFVLGFVAGAKAQREFDPSLWPTTHRIEVQPVD